MLSGKRGIIFVKTFLFAFYKKINSFKKGKHSLDKWQPPTDIIAGYERLLFKYEDAAIYDNLVAIGQPDGTVTVVDLDGS